MALSKADFAWISSVNNRQLDIALIPNATKDNIDRLVEIVKTDEELKSSAKDRMRSIILGTIKPNNIEEL